mmetsp:Transcript_11208/g.14749  ORF Transcript_11208/g.14749 Transcript_11208/m.14749 type:complete len:252 (+) Transcript_11208:109-864(+)|eukprot:CAMPEP_0198145444 /NCGR_PEP_ID=MMETSP1443-20131203/23523_1 /TAXON_ID=186043 /ORGANISM="Entomoneis sp., Strain CCMP2396" /LENGTH=251 /DNA_ID=CAMNT_0043809097 /DNA_START=44 /DNA_END=799 /DNA_ORIENTATION=+
MSQELRKRNLPTVKGSSNQMEGYQIDDQLASRYAAGLRVPSMLKASPQHAGDVHKLHIPLLFYVLPKFIQQWMLKFKFFSFLGLLPSWEPRFLIVLGRFVYKFSNRHDVKAPPKGRPVPMDSADFFNLPESDITYDQNAAALMDRPVGSQHVLVFSTLRKTHYYAVPSKVDAVLWLNTLQQAKQEAIKRSMGHCPPGSYPATWSLFDNLGDNLVKSKERIEKRLQEGEQRELEMTSMGIGGPPGVSSGIYG